MKLKLLAIGVIAGVAIFLWARLRHPEIRKSAPTESVLVNALSTPSSDQPPVAIQAARPQPAFSPLPSKSVADGQASIHLKLHKWLEAQKNDTEDDEAQSMQELLAMLTATNAPEILQSLSAEEQNTPFGLAALDQWMHADPVNAANWIAALPNATVDQTGVVAQGWAGDKAGLQNYLDQLPNTAWKQSLLQEAGSQMWVKDPVEAVNLADQMNPGDARTSLLLSVACSWMDSDPNAALNWIQSVNDPLLREQLTASAAKSYALTDPQQAVEWLVSTVKSGVVMNDAALNIIETWASKDPKTAANWAVQLPDGTLKESFLNIISSHSPVQ